MNRPDDTYGDVLSDFRRHSANQTFRLATDAVCARFAPRRPTIITDAEAERLTQQLRDEGKLK